jgi:GntR family transcriptional regulator
MAAERIYIGIKNRILASILRGELKVDDTLPPEEKLAEQFCVSRGTLRLALQELEQEEVIERRQRVGTRVKRIPREKHGLVSMRQQIEDRGRTPEVRVLGTRRLALLEAEGFVRDAFLQDAPGAPQRQLFYVDRLFLGDGEPLVRQMVYLPAEQFEDAPGELEQVDFSQGLYAIYLHFNRRIDWAEETIHARFADPQEAAWLGLDSPSLVYERRRLSFDQHQRLVEVLVSIDRGDFFENYRYIISSRGSGPS